MNAVLDCGSRRAHYRIVVAGIVAAVCFQLGARVCQACDNPVWEYAMLNWRQHSHHVYYLHRGAEPMRDRAANRILERAADPETGHANLIFKRIDLRRINQDTPEALRNLAAKYADAPLPVHIVLTPRWEETFVGRLTPADARALVQSPVRRRLARLLSEGSNGALLVLRGADEAGSDAVRAQAVRAIKVAEEHDWRVGLVEVSRDDPREAWLVRHLLMVRPGLGDSCAPMVFGAFGRAHVEGPHVAQYTDASYLLELIAFMNGPCTCMMNPVASGLDLLTTWDWESCVQQWAPIAERQLEPGGYVTF